MDLFLKRLSAYLINSFLEDFQILQRRFIHQLIRANLGHVETNLVVINKASGHSWIQRSRGPFYTPRDGGKERKGKERTLKERCFLFRFMV